jgi:hypothetical protein
LKKYLIEPLAELLVYLLLDKQLNAASFSLSKAAFPTTKLADGLSSS